MTQCGSQAFENCHLWLSPSMALAPPLLYALANFVLVVTGNSYLYIVLLFSFLFFYLSLACFWRVDHKIQKLPNPMIRPNCNQTCLKAVLNFTLLNFSLGLIKWRTATNAITKYKCIMTMMFLCSHSLVMTDNSNSWHRLCQLGFHAFGELIGEHDWNTVVIWQRLITQLQYGLRLST